MENITLEIRGMACTGCSQRLEKVLKNTDGVIHATVDFETKKAKINFNKEEVSLDEINEVIVDAGFEVE